MSKKFQAKHFTPENFLCSLRERLCCVREKFAALAKQFIRLGNTKFKYSKEKDRGYIDSLNFSIDGEKTKWDYHPEWIDVIKDYRLEGKKVYS